MFTKGLHPLDWIVIVASLIGSLYVGAIFARKQKTTGAYFSANRSIPSWAVGMSILATLISSVTFLAYPAAGYRGQWILLVQAIAVVVVLLGLVWFVVPLYRKVIGLSAYEYFEKRFGLLARFYSSIAFALTHFSKMGTVFFLMGGALTLMFGFPENKTAALLVIWGIGILIIALTLMGGIEAVIWLDVIQGFLLILGGLISVIVLMTGMPGGMSAFFDFVRDKDAITFGPYAWDFTRLTFVVMFINGIFYGIQKYGTDQTIVQRYLTAKSDKGAVKAGLMGVLLSLPVWALFMFIGTLLLAFYSLGTNTLPSDTAPKDVFVIFIMNKLPIGVSGLIISALIAAAFSSLDSDLNCLSAISVEDYYKRFKPQSTDAQQLAFGRMVVIASGIASLLVATLYVALGGEGVLGIVFGLYAIFSGGIAGIFLLGLFSKRANAPGLNLGILVCVLFTAYAVLTSQKFGDKTLLDLGDWNFKQHKYMLGVYSHLIVIGVGWMASFLFPSKQVEEELTIYGWLKSKKRLAGQA